MNIEQMEFYHFLEGKRVVLVGPAETTIGSKQGSIIESYDVVVRINNVVENMPFKPRLQKDIGKRMDILYASGVKPFRFTKDSLPKFIRHRNKPFIMREKKRKNIPKDILRICSIFVSTKLEEELGSFPTTGMCAIYDLLSHPIKELYVMGFTFFQSGGHIFRRNPIFHRNTLIKEIGIHRPQKELELFKKLIRSFDLSANIIIRLDKSLEELCR